MRYAVLITTANPERAWALGQWVDSDEATLWGREMERAGHGRFGGVVTLASVNAFMQSVPRGGAR